MEGRHEGSIVYKTLTRPRQFAGVDVRVGAAIWMIAGWLAMVFNSPWHLLLVWFGAAMLLHTVARTIGRREPYWFNIYKRYMRQSDRYEPWPQYIPSRGLRPIGFGRAGWKG